MKWEIRFVEIVGKNYNKEGDGEDVLYFVHLE